MADEPGDPGVTPATAAAVAPLPIVLLPGGANGGEPPPERADGLPTILIVEVGGVRFCVPLFWVDESEPDDEDVIPWSAVTWYQVIGPPPASRCPIGLPWCPSPPIPDGSIGDADRRRLAMAYGWPLD